MQCKISPQLKCHSKFIFIHYVKIPRGASASYRGGIKNCKQQAQTPTHTHTHKRTHTPTAERWLYVAKSSRAAASGAFIFINPFLGTVCQLATQLQLPAPSRCPLLYASPSLLLSALCFPLLLLLSLFQLLLLLMYHFPKSPTLLWQQFVAFVCFIYRFMQMHTYITLIYTLYICVCCGIVVGAMRGWAYGKCVMLQLIVSCLILYECGAHAYGFAF